MNYSLYDNPDHLLVLDYVWWRISLSTPQKVQAVEQTPFTNSLSKDCSIYQAKGYTSYEVKKIAEVLHLTKSKLKTSVGKLRENGYLELQILGHITFLVPTDKLPL